MNHLPDSLCAHTSQCIRPMSAADLAAVVQVQAAVYPSGLHETADVLARKLELAPDWCFVATRDGEVAAYLFSHPWVDGAPPAVHGWLERLPAAADCWFVHDLAVHPRLQGHGLARQLLGQGVRRARAAGHRRVRLVAVQGAATFWRRQGFIPLAAGGEILGPYGADACLMHADLLPSADI